MSAIAKPTPLLSDFPEAPVVGKDWLKDLVYILNGCTTRGKIFGVN